MKKYILYLTIPFVLLACDNKESIENSTPPLEQEVVITDTHTAENSLDWDGVYQGTYPCADCEGIKTSLTLSKDYTYVLKEEYIKNGSIVSSNQYEGKFSFQEKNTSLIKLDDNAQQRVFFIGEEFAEARDRDTGEVLSDLLDYKLIKLF